MQQRNYVFDFTDQLVVVTGITGGLGTAIAAAFRDCGARVVGIDLRPLPHGEFPVFTADVSRADEVAEAFSALTEEHGPLRVLANNAGIREIKTILELSPEEWEQVVGVNLNGAFYCAREAALRMKENGGGSIITTSSVAGFLALPSRPAYTATKHALVGLTKQMALDLAPYGIRANAVSPGNIRTPLTEPCYADEQWVADLGATIPLGGTGTAADVADVFLYLASPFASYITGHALVVDGGFISSKAFSYGSAIYSDSSASLSNTDSRTG